jgi:N-methylhydantoinase A/oxoprolinase/acetone carboxylase beta subunit
MANAEASSSTHHKEKRDKKERKAERKEKKDKKDKKERKALMGGAGVEGPFEHRVQRMRLSVPPKFAADWLEGVRETLNVMLMQ